MARLAESAKRAYGTDKEKSGYSIHPFFILAISHMLYVLEE